MFVRVIMVYLKLFDVSVVHIKLLYIYIYMFNMYQYVVDVVPLMKTAGVVENSGHCICSIG